MDHIFHVQTLVAEAFSYTDHEPQITRHEFRQRLSIAFGNFATKVYFIFGLEQTVLADILKISIESRFRRAGFLLKVGNRRAFGASRLSPGCLFCSTYLGILGE